MGVSTVSKQQEEACQLAKLLAAKARGVTNEYPCPSMGKKNTLPLQPRCSRCCCVLFAATAFSSHRHPPHPVSVPIRHPREKSYLRVRNFEPDTFTASTRSKISGTVTESSWVRRLGCFPGGCFPGTWRQGSWHSCHHFPPTISSSRYSFLYTSIVDFCPLHIELSYFSFLGEHSGRRMSPAERSAMYQQYLNTPGGVWGLRSEVVVAVVYQAHVNSLQLLCSRGLAISLGRKPRNMLTKQNSNPNMIIRRIICILVGPGTSQAIIAHGHKDGGQRRLSV